ncbi:MAG: ribosome silencing factor [Thermoanaerobacteraceae bacterium]|nr:ribosome silencing factor [Thermoanaerobacteraceae bacterium]
MFSSPLEIAGYVAEIMEDKKAEDIEILEIKDLTVIADYFVICTGKNPTQISSICDEIQEKLEEQGIKAGHIEGLRGKNWILMDYGSVVVHIFSPVDRDFYKLDRIWADARRLSYK